MDRGSPHRRAVCFAVALVALAGCNTVQWLRSHYQRKMVAAGLRPEQLVLGAERVHLWQGGRGDTVLLVHGFGADAIWQWHPQVAALGSRRVIVPDLLWFGQSHSQKKDFSIGHQVRMLIALLDRLAVGRADVVGISYGGLVAYELARLHPARVRRLVLVNSPGRHYTLLDYRELCLRFGVSDASEVFVPAEAAGVERLTDLAYWDPPYLPELAAHQVQRELYTLFRKEKIALLRALVDDLARAAPSDRITAQTLILWGREDQVFPLRLGERLAQRIGRRARLIVIDRARHAPNLEHPAVFNAHLTAFLAR